MITLYKSEKTNKIYSSEDALKADEKAFDLKQAQMEKMRSEKTARAKEIEELYKKIQEDTKLYNEKLRAFIQDYKEYHTTFRVGPTSLSDFFDMFF